MKETIAVIGAGVMGTGVAHNFAQHGYKVTLVDHLESQLKKSKQLIKRNLRLYDFHGEHYRSPLTRDMISDNITFTSDLESVSKARVIIENVTEDWDIKKRLYGELKQVCSPDVLWGVNTSAVSVTRLAALLPTPQNVIGVHFMNPVPLKPMVELIRGFHTSVETITAFGEILKQLNKKYIVVNDSPGFVTNRAMMLFINEAIFMISENVAACDEIDILFKECFGHKMGPLQTADLIGLDTILLSLNMLYEGFNDDKFRPCFLLKKMVDGGLLGMKSGKGFYEY